MTRQQTDRRATSRDILDITLDKIYGIDNIRYNIAKTNVRSSTLTTYEAHIMRVLQHALSTTKQSMIKHDVRDYNIMRNGVGNAAGITIWRITTTYNPCNINAIY